MSWSHLQHIAMPALPRPPASARLGWVQGTRQSVRSSIQDSEQAGQTGNAVCQVGLEGSPELGEEAMCREDTEGMKVKEPGMLPGTGS